MKITNKLVFEGIVQSWGNSLGIRITRPMSDMANIGRGDKIAIKVTEEGLFISRKETKKSISFPFSENELIADITAHKAHADEIPIISEKEIGR